MATNIMDLFRSRQPAPAPQQPNAQQGQQQPNAVQGAQGQPQVPGQPNVQGPGTMPNQGQQPSGPGNNPNASQQQQPAGIDKFSKMWDSDASQSDAPPSFNIDPTKIKEVASSQDFMQGIDPELMQKATSGDVQALMQLINNVGQNTYAKALEHTSTLTDRFVGAREAHNAKSMGTNVRKELTTSALSSIPNFKHPVVQKQLKETAERLQKMHPDATAQEIVAMTTEYFQELMGAINPDSVNNNSKAKPKTEERGEDYWNQFFDAAAQDEN